MAGGMQVDFYHLTSNPVENILVRIAERVVEGGGRLLIVAEAEDLARRIDERLWIYAPESFLPHGRVGESGDAIQPILIASTIDAVNGARNIAFADGVWRDEGIGFDRAFLLFADDRIEEARAVWRGIGGRDDVERRFWKQDDAGKWSRVA